MQQELPMVVWLRGDESHFSDFTIEADEAMARLQIKRSRLTQISGRELRVGRRRDGRYLKPFYRPEDIDKYLEWVRPTASHGKSSQVLFDAAQDLAAKSSQLETFYEGFERDFARFLQSNIRRSEFDLVDQLKTLVKKLRREINNDVTPQINSLHHGLANLGQHQSRAQGEIEQTIACKLEPQAEMLAKTLGAVEYQRLLLDRLLMQLTEQTQVMQDFIARQERFEEALLALQPKVRQPFITDRQVVYCQAKKIPEKITSPSIYFVPKG